ncbi:hypothetical protein Fot_51776 [Forsythia ovata]|uniref:Uncharacterized protein n=1 Tax=Forsythia ovata TaxID=205694 RepID=A0ABD1Q0F1_9LAMI
MELPEEIPLAKDLVPRLGTLPKGERARIHKRIPTNKMQNLNVYTASNIKEELEAAKREFVQANVVVKRLKKVFLPKIIEKYVKEAYIHSDDLLKWVAENVDKKLQDTIQNCLDRRPNKRASLIIKWLPYNSRFRYVFSKELMEKPWWA